MTRDWLKQRERGSPFLVRFMLNLALKVGRRPARLLLFPITLYFLATAQQARTASRAFLARVLERPAGWRDLFRHLHTFAAVILDRVFFLSGRHAMLDVRMVGNEVLDRFLKEGRGCLLLGAHHGSFEALRALAISDMRLPVKVLMYPDHNGFITHLLDALNPEVSRSVIPLGHLEAPLRVREALAEGCLVGLLGDRIAEGNKTIRHPFLGKETHFPAGPMRLATVLNAPVVLFFGLYRGGNRYDIHFELLTEAAAGGPGGVEALTRRYAERLEYYVRLARYNWFNFYDFWNENAADD